MTEKNTIRFALHAVENGYEMGFGQQDFGERAAIYVALDKGSMKTVAMQAVEQRIDRILEGLK